MNKNYPRLPDISSETGFINDVLVNNAFEGILIIKDEQIIFSNKPVNNMLNENSFSGSIYKIVYNDDIEIVKNAYHKIINGEKIESFNFRVKMPDNSITYLLANGTSIKYANEPAILVFVKNITKRKDIESALKLSEKRYRVLVEKSSDIFVEIDAEGNQVFVSPVAEVITGYELSELQNKPFAEVIHPEDHAQVFEMWELAIKNPQQRHRIEYRHIHKTKGYIWVEAHGQSFLHDPNINRVFTFVRDISDRKELELKLKEQQKKYQIITENISDVIWIFNASQMKFTYISPSVERLRGYTVEEAMLQSITESLAPESLAIVQKHLIEAMEILSKEPTRLIKATDELRQPCKNGKLIWIEVSSTIQLNNKREVEVLGVSRNIDKRKKATQALKESEEKYRKLIQNMDEGMVLFDQSKTIVSYNEASKRILNVETSLKGLTSEDFRDRTIKPDGTPFLPKDHPASISINEKRPVRNVEMGILNDESITWIKINVEYLLLGDENHGYALVNFYDITQLKESNKELISANKTKDKFISIMAHDLKSPFNAILGYTELLMDSANEIQNEDIFRMAQATHNSSIHAVALLDNLLEWSRAQTGKLKFEPCIFSIQELIDDIILGLQSVAARKSVTIHTEVSDCKQVFGDQNMIHTILRNLISNAIKFSYREGEITVNCALNHNAWIIKVSDYGLGMQQRTIRVLLSSEQPLSNVGTEGEHGTGLGFSVIKEFVKLHNAKIDINSIPAKGTTIKVTFPMK